MSTKTKTYLNELHHMEPVAINALAIKLLDRLLQRCTLHMITQLTGITRATLYKWLDEDQPLESMNHRDAAWFILKVETDPKVLMLMQRGPLSNPRLAGRLIEEASSHD